MYPGPSGLGWIILLVPCFLRSLLQRCVERSAFSVQRCVQRAAARQRLQVRRGHRRNSLHHAAESAARLRSLRDVLQLELRSLLRPRLATVRRVCVEWSWTSTVANRGQNRTKSANIRLQWVTGTWDRVLNTGDRTLDTKLLMNAEH